MFLLGRSDGQGKRPTRDVIFPALFCASNSISAASSERQSRSTSESLTSLRLVALPHISPLFALPWHHLSFTVLLQCCRTEHDPV
ncbi:hypothetical protein DENSPDRAFT_624722 [Dentipellis sp. KUC8613]|nr:hypothetical protein DENSPDRAFT_624722 [Dentipellis sp. KUC8613]